MRWRIYFRRASSISRQTGRGAIDIGARSSGQYAVPLLFDFACFLKRSWCDLSLARTEDMERRLACQGNSIRGHIRRYPIGPIRSRSRAALRAKPKLLAIPGPGESPLCLGAGFDAQYSLTSKNRPPMFRATENRSLIRDEACRFRSSVSSLTALFRRRSK